MEIFLIGLLLTTAVLFVVVIGLIGMLASARKRADTADARADEKIQVGMMRVQEHLAKAEKHLRADAIKKSTAVVKGKVAEQLVPFGTEFGYNPRNARFLGSPIDLLVFAGLTEGELDKVVFIEVKTGKSRLSRRERQLRDVIDAGEVYWEELRV